MLLNEVAPAAPFLIDALPALTTLAALLFALGCVYMLKGFVKALFGGVESLIGHVPLVGGALDSATRSAEQAVSNALGSAESAIDAHIGAQFHRLAAIGRRLWHVLEEMALVSWTITKAMQGQLTWNDLRTLVRPLTNRLHALEHQATVIERQVVNRTRVIRRTVAQGVFPRLGALEHEVDRVLPKEIRHARELAKEAERVAEKAWQLVKDRPWVVGTTAFAGAVAIALESLGASWVRCTNTGRVGRALCGAWGNLLGDLLEGLVDVMIVADLCAISEVMIAVAESAPVQDALAGLIDGIDELLLCQGTSRPGDWQVHAAALPPAQAYSSLPGVT